MACGNVAIGAGTTSEYPLGHRSGWPLVLSGGVLLSRQYSAEELNTLANLFAKTFISRPDVKAFQRPNGDWYPMRERITREDLIKHITGQTSMGHYLASTENRVKFFAFDIDLEEAKIPGKTMTWPEGRYYPMPIKILDRPESASNWENFVDGDPRAAWENPYRPQYVETFLIYQMRRMAHILATTAEGMLGYRTMVTYSGHKGVHVYVLLDGAFEASDAREAAVMVLDQTNRFELLRGKNFYKHRAIEDDPVRDMPQLSVEIFPKQDTVTDKEKQLGNLMRLPLGRNMKVPDGVEHYLPQFLDVRHRMTEFKERDPIEALTISDQWAGVMTE